MTSPAAGPDVVEDAAAADQRRRREKAAAAAEARLVAAAHADATAGGDHHEATLLQASQAIELDPTVADELQQLREIEVAERAVADELQRLRESEVAERAEPSSSRVPSDIADDPLADVEELLRRLDDQTTASVPRTRGMGFMDMMNHAAEYAPYVAPTPRPAPSPERARNAPLPACPEGVDPAVWAQLPPEARQWAIADPEEDATPTAPQIPVLADPLRETSGVVDEPSPRSTPPNLGYTSHGPVMGPPTATAWRGGPEIPGFVGVGSNIRRAEPSMVQQSGDLNRTVAEPDVEPMPVERGKCLICIDAVADATFVHGETGHTVCCLSCAKEVEQQADTCPMCRQPFLLVIRNFTT